MSFCPYSFDSDSFDTGVGASGLTVKIYYAGAWHTVDCVSAKLNFRTINQGHMMFILTLDNYGGQYDGLFDANDSVEIRFNNVLIFKGVIDSDKHALDQGYKWNFTDYLRVAGRDQSFELSNLKYIRTFPSTMQFDDMIKEAFTQTGCTIGFTISDTVTISGHTSEDQYLLDLVRETLQKAGYEGYVDLAKALQYFAVGSATKDTGIAITDANCLGNQHIEIEGSDIRNTIKVFGKLRLFEPETRDIWTDDPLHANWTQLVGTGLTVQAGGKVGSHYVRCNGAIQNGTTYVWFRFLFPEIMRVGLYGQYGLLGLYIRNPIVPLNNKLTILLEDSFEERFYTELVTETSTAWQYFEIPLGHEQTYSDEFPDGIWHKLGNPDWLNIKYIHFQQIWDNQDENDRVEIDDLWLGKKAVHGVASDATSISNYLKRENSAILVASSNAEAQKDADETLAQMKGPMQSLKVITPASTFIVGGVWKGLVGHRINVYGTTYRIIDLTVDIAPYQNLKDGYDAIAVFNCVPVTAKIEPDSYAPIMTPTPQTQVAAILRKYEMKNEWKRGG